MSQECVQRLTETARHLENPRQDDDGRGCALLVVPYSHSGSFAIIVRHVVTTQAALHHFLLGSRIGLSATVMGRVYPPNDGKEGCPRRRKNVIREEEVCEV